MKKSAYSILFFTFVLLLALPKQPAAAQTEPKTTPTDGYPPPATPGEPEEAYPIESATALAPEEAPGYVAPTRIIATAVIGDGVTEATAVPTLPISQSAVVRNRAILWAGFLITLLIFLLAMYGAMLMYTRRSN